MPGACSLSGGRAEGSRATGLPGARAVLLVAATFQVAWGFQAVGTFEQIAHRAEEAAKAGRPEAAALYERALRLKPDWKDGWWALGGIHYGHGQFVQCAREFEHVTRLDARAGPAWTMLGLCENGAGDFPAALNNLRQGQQLGAGNAAIDGVAKYHLARLYTKSGAFEQALAVLYPMAQTGRGGEQWIMLAGTAALWRPSFPEETPASDRELVFLAGQAFWNAGARRAADARESFDALLAKYPSSSGVRYLHGSFELADHPEQAVVDFEAELKNSPGHPGALTALAAEYLREGQPAKGLAYAQQATAVLPESPASHALLGRILTETGALEDGLKELETARQLGPDEPQTRIALASTYAKMGRQEDAARERREFLRLKASTEKPGER